MSIDHGKVLAEIEHEITAMATKVDVTVRLGRASNIMAKVRALAQPAEAVELPTPYHYADGGKGEPLFTANQVRAAVAVATDAAQGAVAFGFVCPNELAQLKDGVVAFVYPQQLSGTVPAYTHPQAAPSPEPRS